MPASARAGGLFLMPRGAEAAARAGARVAGADDPGALWYNPAGLISSGRQLLVDATLPIVRTTFTRVLSNGMREPTVSAPSKVIPIPTLGYTDNFGLRRWAFGLGLLVPPGHVPDWPSSVEVDGVPRRAPQRYSVLNNDGSALGQLALGAAYRVFDAWTVGAAVLVTAASLGAEVAISACDYVVCSQPEGREWEGRTRFLLGPLYTATATFGTTFEVGPLRIGASALLPTRIAGQADFDVQLPDQKFFDDVQVLTRGGSDDLRAALALRLPAILRFGVEVLPVRVLRLEAAGSYEFWSVRDSISVRPKDVVITNLPGIGTVAAQPLVLARNMRDTWSVALGSKWALGQQLAWARALDLSAGAAYESAAFADRDLSPSTLDTQKLLVGLGASIELFPQVTLDVSAGHLFMRDRNVDDSAVLLPTVIKPVPKDADPRRYEVGDRPAIGNGSYRLEANFVGLGLRWRLPS